MNDVKCPFCGSTSYRLEYSTHTAMYAPIEYHDGKPTSSDPNIETSYCTCLECQNAFIMRSQYGRSMVFKT